MYRILARTLCTVAGLLGTAGASADGGIRWHDWEAAAFAAAAAGQKMIMVNVGHEGCTACRYMETNTFTDATVITLVNDHFVSIQVDSIARPDIGERYSDWAWPATAFLRPDATQVMALRGSLRPDRFTAILKDLIAKHESGELPVDDREPYVAPAVVNSGPLTELQTQVRRQLDRGYDDEVGGWGKAKVLDYAEPTLQFLLRGHLYDDDLATQRGLRNARGFAQQVDEVWGGIYYASFRTWGNTVKEKRTESQAAALQIFAAAYQLTGDQLFRERLRLIDDYLRTHMRADDGLVFASQKDTVPGMQDLDIDDYYALDDAGRRSRGMPLTDHATYTDLNARVLEGYVRAYEATGEQHYLDSAIAIAHTLVTERQTEAGWLVQSRASAEVQADERVHVLRFDERPYLRTQAYAGLAMLALYQAAADTRWLDVALRIGRALGETLEDPEHGGFFGSPADGTEAVIARRKPVEDNAVAARFLFLLGVASKDDAMKLSAVRALRAAAAPAVVRREGRVTGNLAMALELIEAGYVEFSVVGDEDDPAARELLAAGLSVFEPRKVVHFEKPGRYPARDTAAMYICNDDACSLPITAAGAVPDEAAKFVPSVFAGRGFAGKGKDD